MVYSQRLEALVVVVVLAVVVSVGDAVRLMDTMTELGKRIQQLMRSGNMLQDACDGSFVECEAETLMENLAAFSALQGEIDENLGPATELFQQITDTKADVVSANNIYGSINTALKVASNIPYVGTPFKGPSVAIGLLDKPLDTATNSLKTLVGTMVSPWELSIGKIVTALGTINENIDNVVDMIINIDPSSEVKNGLASLLEAQCPRNLLNVLAPGASSAINAVKSAIKALGQSLGKVVTGMRAVVNAMNGQVWTKLSTSMNTVIKSLSSVTKIFNGLKPLAGLLEKKIKLPWVKITGRKTDGTPRFCPSGYMKGTFSCLSDCDEGYSSDKLGTCLTDCPDGYETTGARCKNKNYYIPNTKARKLTCKGGCKFRCPSGYSTSDVGLICYENCPSGWSRTDVVLFTVCYKGCPLGMEISDDRKTCKKVHKKQDTKKFQCASGYENIVTVCTELCPSGSTNIGVACVAPTTLSFSIKDIADELEKVIKKIEKIELFQKIKSGIEKLVMAVLEPIMDWLGIPTPDQIVSTITGALDDLPFADLANALEAIDMSSVLDKLDFSDVINSQISNLFKGMKIDTSLLNMDVFEACVQDTSCLLKKLKIDVEVPNLSELTMAMGDFETVFDNDETLDKLTDVLSHFDGDLSCKTSKTVKIPVEASLAEMVGRSASTSPCELEFDVCTSYDTDKVSAQAAVNALRDTLEPLINKIAVVFGTLESASLLEMGEKMGQSVFNKENFLIPFLAIPLFPQVGFRFDKVARQFFILSYVKKLNKEQNTIVGSSMQTSMFPPILSLWAGKVDGKPVINVSVRLTFYPIRLSLARNTVRDELVVELNRLMDLMKDVQVNPEYGFTHCFNAPSYPKNCEYIRKWVLLLKKPELWKWQKDEPCFTSNLVLCTKMEKVLSMYDGTNAYWKTSKGRVTASNMMWFFQERKRDLQKCQVLMQKPDLSLGQLKFRAWLLNSKQTLKDLVKYGIKRMILSPVVYASISREAVVPAIGINVQSYAKGGAGFMYLMEILTGKPRMARIYIPMLQRWMPQSMSAAGLEVSLQTTITINHFWSV